MEAHAVTAGSDLGLPYASEPAASAVDQDGPGAAAGGLAGGCTRLCIVESIVSLGSFARIG